MSYTYWVTRIFTFELPGSDGIGMTRTLTSLVTTDIPPPTTTGVSPTTFSETSAGTVPSATITSPSTTTSLPSPSTASPTPSTSATASTNSQRNIKIALGVTIPVVVIVSLVTLLFRQRWKQRRKASTPQDSLPELEAHDNATPHHELDAKNNTIQSSRPLDIDYALASFDGREEAELPADQHLYGGSLPVEIGNSGVSTTAEMSAVLRGRDGTYGGAAV